jgi:hypothetical protein
MSQYASALCSLDAIHIDEKIGFLEKLKQEANPSLNRAQRSIDSHERFLKNRDRASEIIAAELIKWQSSKRPGVAVAVVGAGHTRRISTLLSEGGAAFAVVDMPSFKKAAGGEVRSAPLRREGFLADGGLLGQVIVGYYDSARMSEWEKARAKACLDGNRKERPIIGEIFYSAKAQTHEVIDQFTRTVAAGAAGGGIPPDEPGLQGKFASEDPRWNKSLVRADAKRAYITSRGKGLWVVFPISFFDINGKSIGKELWVAGRLADPAAGVAYQTDVSKLIEAAIKEERDRRPAAPDNQPTKPKEPIRISAVVEARFGEDADGLTSQLGRAQ